MLKIQNINKDKAFTDLQISCYIENNNLKSIEEFAGIAEYFSQVLKKDPLNIINLVSSNSIKEHCNAWKKDIKETPSYIVFLKNINSSSKDIDLIISNIFTKIPRNIIEEKISIKKDKIGNLTFCFEINHTDIGYELMKIFDTQNYNSVSHPFENIIFSYKIFLNNNKKLTVTDFLNIFYN